jgi:hypothetical protein
MPVTNIIPNATTSPLGGGNHTTLTDGSDASFISAQLSQFETVKYAYGLSCTHIPSNSAKVNSIVTKARGYISSNPGDHANILAGPGIPVGSGPGSWPNVLGQNMTTSVAAYSGTTTGVTAVQVNSMGWWAGATFGSNDGMQFFVTELNYDVTWFPVSGFHAFIIGLIGPAIGAGILLQEIPRLSAELWKRTRTRLLPEEYVLAWRDLRSARHAKSVLL